MNFQTPLGRSMRAAVKCDAADKAARAEAEAVIQRWKL